MVKMIIGYEEYYTITDCGNVYSLRRRKYMKNQKDKNGYYCINLAKNGNVKRFFIHTLVFLSFGGEIKSGYTVNHIDGNKENNNINNIECITLIENIKHAIDNGLIYSRKVTKYTKSGTKIKTYKSMRKAARESNTYLANIHRCCNGINNTAGGYMWKYTNECNDCHKKIHGVDNG